LVSNTVFQDNKLRILEEMPGLRVGAGNSKMNVELDS
jgi:hypothetical protein